MKRLVTMLVVFAVLMVCAPSNGYILVYKMTSTMKTVETDANLMMNMKIKGNLVLDINDTEKDVNESMMVYYGRDVNDSFMYYIEDFTGNPRVIWHEQGDFLTVEIINHRANFEYDFRLIGKLKAKNVGFGGEPNELREVASTLKGAMYSTAEGVDQEGFLLDDVQCFFGSGTAKLTLDTRKTYAANESGQSILDIITETVEGEKGLITKGYNEFPTLP